MSKNEKKLSSQKLNVLKNVNGGTLDVKIEMQKNKNIIDNSKKAFIDGTIEGDITLLD